MMGALGQQFKIAGEFWMNEHWTTLPPEFLNQDQYCQVLKQECPITWVPGFMRSQEDCAALKQVITVFAATSVLIITVSPVFSRNLIIV